MTDSPIADVNDTLLPWASTAEAALAARLHDVELFVDLDIAGDQLERYSRFFGTFLSRQLAAGADPAALLAACPALTATALITRAARFNRVGELPREFWAGLGLEPTDERLTCVEGRFAEILSAAGLDPFDEAVGGPDGENGRLFLHVGLATDWIPEVVEAFDSRRQDATAVDDTEQEAAAVVQQLAGGELQAGPLCTLKPQIAQRLFTPLVQVIRHAEAHPETWEYTLPAVKLPRLILEDVIEELRERPVGTEDRRYAVGVAHREDQPRLRLDVDRNRVVLRLPAQSLPSVEEEPAAEIRWRVDTDGRPHAFRTGRSEHLGGSDSEVVDLPIRRPLRELHVHSMTHGEHWTLPVINRPEPALIFSVRGAELTELDTLHRVSVIVVCPEDTTAVDPVQDRSIPVVWERPMKLWDGWVIRRLDLSDALSLHIERSGERRPSMDTMRAVDPRQRVLFVEPDQPEPSIETASGKPIFSESLRVEFPPTISGDTELWHVSVSAYAGPGVPGEAVSEEEPLEVSAEGGVFDVFDPEAYDSPWVGEYLVRLRGPRYESFRHEFALVEGMNVEVEIDGASPHTRLPLTAGLSPTTVRLRSGDKPFERIAPLHLSPSDRFATAVIETDAGDALPVVVNPPRIRFQLPMQGEAPVWRTEALRIAANWLDLNTRFRVRPEAAISDARLVVRDRHGSPARSAKLQTQDNVTWWVNLQAIAPSVQIMSEGSLELEFVDAAAGRRVSVRMARIVPGSEVTVTYMEDHTLDVQCDDPDRLTGKALWIWPLTAPWEPARSVKIGAPLPAELRDAGPLAVQLFSTDRFNFLRAPEFPGSRAVRVDHPGFFGGSLVDAASPYTQLSAFLAGETDQLPQDTEILPTLWDVLAGGLKHRVSAEGGSPVMGDLHAKLREALSVNPAASMHAMSTSLVPASDRPAQFISSGLVQGKVASENTDGESHDKKRRGDAPWIAALEVLSDLFTEEDDTAHAKALRTELAEIAGHTLVETMDTGRDRTLETACIDATTVQIAHLDPAQQKAVLDSFFNGAGVVPGALSEENTRLISVFETFTQREQLSELLGDPELMTTAVKILRKVKSSNRQLYLSARVRFERLDGVDTDDPANRWALVPVLSMMFALAARMYAHGRLSNLGKLPNVYGAWSEMARLVPDLVTGDIVSAEAMVLGVFGPDAEPEEVEAED
ncbi:hypothetical protein [Corynebacterium dentalis]|uniref:hypothetical protein n=1 Tax=Corynebacterium dentalis TaxID=2014528 RepID=UPI0028A1483F|nr:hypothetical protein [Corynebacterium dentalis]